jgi:hypothetical protein
MKIALFTDTYPDDINGVARTLGMLVAHAARRGHEIALVTPRVSPGGADGAVVHRQLPGIPIPIYPDLQLARGIDRKGRRRFATSPRTSFMWRPSRPSDSRGGAGRSGTACRW